MNQEHVFFVLVVANTDCVADFTSFFEVVMMLVMHKLLSVVKLFFTAFLRKF